MTGWTYYNHAMIPTTMPHEEPDLTPLHTGELWNVYGGGHHYSPGGQQTLTAEMKPAFGPVFWISLLKLIS